MLLHFSVSFKNAPIKYHGEAIYPLSIYQNCEPYTDSMIAFVKADLAKSIKKWGFTAGEILKRIQSKEMKTMWNNVINGTQEDKDKLKEFYVQSIINHIQSILLFKHYAKVETIHAKPKEKVRDPNSKEKHFNETDIPINILDCRWFNNIIRNEPFGVRGHFRLQPKKDESGKWIKEMIYIKPFIKKGYNLKARKLK